MCEHLGYHTPETRYDRDAQLLRFFAVCDECGLTLHELFTQHYLPEPKLTAA